MGVESKKFLTSAEDALKSVNSIFEKDVCLPPTWTIMLLRLTKPLVANGAFWKRHYRD